MRVLFRGGILTEWYPQGTRVESQTWPARGGRHPRQYRDRMERREDPAARHARHDSRHDPRQGRSGDHYYVARETDANFLRVSRPLARKNPEHERDLFYRGLGYFQAPLAVGIDADEQQLSFNAREAELIDGAFLLSIRQGMMRYQKIDGAISSARRRSSPNVQPFGAPRDVRKEAMR